MKLCEISIYAVRDEDGEVLGFSFDPEPKPTDAPRTCRHRLIDRDDPEGDIVLVGFATCKEAAAFACGLEIALGDFDWAWEVRTIADDLTCVLVENLGSGYSQLFIEDHRNAAEPAAIGGTL